MGNVNFKYLEVIRLNYDNGTKGKFKFLDLIQLNEDNYIVLLPVGGNGSIVQIFKLENMESKSTLRYLPVENKEIETKVLNIYNNGKNNYLNKKSNKKMIAIYVIIILLLPVIISIPLISSTNKKEIEDNNITISEARSIISKYNSRVIEVDPDCTYKTDENGRKLYTFSYTAHPYNNQGMTMLDRSYSSTMTILIMKRNGIVQYEQWSNSIYNTKYDNFTDFLNKNNWGKPESYGLGNNAHTL